MLLKEECKLKDLKANVDILDTKAEHDGLSDNDVKNQLELLKQIEDLEHLKSLDLKQKAKIKWAIEGDENTKFFHGIVNNNFSRSRINAILIKGCLEPAFALVIVNGSPTKEFKLHKGLRQGDPLSPLLFIIAVEALHVTIQEAKCKGIFQVCNEAIETDQHLFLDCDIAQHLWKVIIKWWRLNDYPKDILGIVTWDDSLSLPTKVKPIFDVVVVGIW
ncbi:RNA-directed DNA polymerase, eukaryota [Tanacetum coccineum]